MFRTTMAAFAALAASACTIGLPSAIDAAPFEARMVTAPFADGLYCNVTKDEDGELRVSGEDGDRSNGCSTFTWSAAQRLFVMRDAWGKETELKLVDLGDGFFLVQMPTLSSARDGETPFAYTLMAGAIEGDVLLGLPLPSNDKVLPFAARYPGLTLSTYKLSSSFPFLAPEPIDGAEPPPPEPDGVYISAGSPADIRDLARDLVDWVLKGIPTSQDNRDWREWKGDGLAVRVQPSQPDHAPSAAQQRDIDAMVAKILAHFQPAP